MTDFDDPYLPDSAPEPPPHEGSRSAPRNQRATHSNSTRTHNVPDLTLDTGLPANVEAEKTILGAVLLDNAAFNEAAEKIQADDFSLDSHRRIFLRMAELMEAHHAVDIITLSHCLAKYKEVESVGGVAYLASLTEGLPRRPVIAEYLLIVKDKSLLRKLMGICSTAIARAADQSESAIEVVASTESALMKIAEANIANRAERAGDFLNRVYPSPEAMMAHTAKQRGIPSGFRDVDELTCGFQPGELILLAGRPSAGKSALAFCIAEHVAINLESPTLFMPFEAGKEALIRRGTCCRARVPMQAFKKGTMDSRMMEEFSAAYEDIKKAPLYIEDAGMTLPQIRIQALRLKSKNMLDLVIVDQLSFLESPPGVNTKNMTREREVAGFARGCKVLAKELNVPVILVCHLKRDVAIRGEKRPTLTDLRESGSLEGDADVVLFVHRPEYYDREDKALRGKGEIVVAKNRDGPTEICNVLFDGPTTRWSDIPDPNDLQGSFGGWGEGIR